MDNFNHIIIHVDWIVDSIDVINKIIDHNLSSGAEEVEELEDIFYKEEQKE